MRRSRTKNRAVTGAHAEMVETERCNLRNRSQAPAPGPPTHPLPEGGAVVRLYREVAEPPASVGLILLLIVAGGGLECGLIWLVIALLSGAMS